MKPEPILSRITIYPVKSLDGMVLEKAMIAEGGCLLHDREYALSDEEGNFMIGKNNPRVYSLRSRFDPENETLSLRRQNETSWKTFHLQKERTAIQSYLTDYFGVSTLLLQNKTGRFLDIPDISGVTVLSTARRQGRETRNISNPIVFLPSFAWARVRPAFSNSSAT